MGCWLGRCYGGVGSSVQSWRLSSLSTRMDVIGWLFVVTLWQVEAQQCAHAAIVWLLCPATGVGAIDYEAALCAEVKW